MIELTDVSKVYRTAHGEVRAVDNLTMSIETGQFVALKGQLCWEDWRSLPRAASRSRDRMWEDSRRASELVSAKRM